MEDKRNSIVAPLELEDPQEMFCFHSLAVYFSTPFLNVKIPVLVYTSRATLFCGLIPPNSVCVMLLTWNKVFTHTSLQSRFFCCRFCYFFDSHSISTDAPLCSWRSLLKYAKLENLNTPEVFILYQYSWRVRNSEEVRWANMFHSSPFGPYGLKERTIPNC